jgi:hypothetical protein
MRSRDIVGTAASAVIVAVLCGVLNLVLGPAGSAFLAACLAFVGIAVLGFAVSRALRTIEDRLARLEQQHPEQPSVRAPHGTTSAEAER